MSSQSRIEVRLRITGACFVLVALGSTLGGCSDIYLDRRETVSLGAGDHIASNTAVQMVDPWPRYVGDKNIAFNGQRSQGAVERYRHHEVIQPRSAATTSTTQALAPSTTEAISLPQGPTTSTPAAAVK
jgi:hypothetical protein